MEERLLEEELEELEGLEEELEEESTSDPTDGNMSVIENVLEFLKNSEDMYVTFSQRRFVTKIKRMAEKHPDEVEILRENSDGSIYAKMPVRALHLNLVKREISDEQRAEAAERLRNWRETTKQKK